MRNLVNSVHRHFNATNTAFFVVLGHARTGTNLLCSLLNSHPTVSCAYEVLHPDDPQLRQKFHREMVEPTEHWLELSPGREKKNTITYIESRLVPKASVSHPFGPKILYWQVQKLKLFTYLARHNFNFLHIARNPVEVYISHEQAQQTGQWFLGMGDTRHQAAPPLDVDPLKLTTFCRSYLDQVRRYNRIGHRLYAVDYADLCGNPQQVMDQVFEFLGVPSVAVDSYSRKQQSWKIMDRISNFEYLLEHAPGDVHSHLSELVG
jgi:LPS sulfotransferase NodH